MSSTLPPRRIGLDAIRAVAAVGVAITHVAFASGVVNEQRWNSPLRWVLPRLDVGVSIFFVLSGYLVARPFVAALIDSTSAPSLRRFAVKRVVRIFPLYWIVLAASLATISVSPGVPRLVADTFLLHIYRPAWAIGPITQSWTLSTELAFYGALPLWCWLMRRVLERCGVRQRADRARWLLVSLAGWGLASLGYRLAVVAITSDYVVGSGDVDARGALLTWLPNHLDHFAVGIAFAIGGVIGWSPLLRQTRILLIAVSVAALALVSGGLDLPPYFTGFTGFQTVARHALNLVIGACMVAAAAGGAWGGPERHARSRVTGSNAISSLVTAAGLGSYGVYLWHQWFTERWLDLRNLADFQAPFPTTLTAVLVLSTVAAVVGYLVVERPALAAADVTSDGLEAITVARRLGRHPGLDGLRGLAILAVLSTHVVFLDNGNDRYALGGGFLGVDVFLSLSGFLIAATLLREADERGDINLLRFLRRRAGRLVPPLLAFLAVHLLVSAALGDPVGEQLRQTVLATFFVSNWQLAAGHRPPFDLVHLWSLAVEAQLYLLCGLGIWAVRRRLERLPLLLVGLGSAVVVVMAWRVNAVRADGSVGSLESIYQRTDLRADSLFVGIAAALLWRSRALPDRAVRFVGGLALAAVAIEMFVARNGDRWLYLGGFSVIALASAASVTAAATDAGWVARFASIGPLRWVGRISYSLYLWHLPVYLWTVRALGQDASLALKAALAIPGSFVLGWAGERFVERRRSQSTRTGVASAGGDSVSQHSVTTTSGGNSSR